MEIFVRIEPRKPVEREKQKHKLMFWEDQYIWSGQTNYGKREGTKYDINQRGLSLHSTSHLRAFKGTLNHSEYKLDKPGKIS